MVNKKILCGLFSIMLAIVFALSSCDMGDNDNGNGTPGGTPGETLPAPSGTNELSGRTYFEYDDITVFSTTVAGSTHGTYTVRRAVYQNGNWETDVNRHFRYDEDRESGTYTWDATAKTIARQPESLAMGDGILRNQSEYRSALQTWINQEFPTQAEMDAWISSVVGFTTIEAYIDFAVNQAFSVRTFDYSFSSENSLFLQESLPANVGTDELNGRTFSGTTWDNQQRKDVKDPNQEYKFNNPTFTRTHSGNPSMTGTYSYNSTFRSASLKPETVNGQNRSDYYATLSNSNNTGFVNSGFQKYFANPNDAKAAYTNDRFRMITKDYDLTLGVVGYID